MALPRKGDPRRPLHLAVRSTRMLAFLFLLCGTCIFGIAFFLGNRTGRSMPTSNALIGILFYVAPGVAYLVFSIFLKRRQFWAVLAALILASIQLLVILIGTAFIVYKMPPQLATKPEMMVPEVILGLIILALAQLVYHLSLSFEAIKHGSPDEQRGFEPLMVQPIDPTEGWNVSGNPSRHEGQM